ncbi:Signal peptidase complex subunit 3A [Dictyocoela muelleri]|nr:Signal peptidase complex subunit 3A [Dictyocoela muelleri]
MKTSITRLYAVLTFSFYPTLLLMFSISLLSRFMRNPHPKADLLIHHYQPFSFHETGHQQGSIIFTPNVDLSSEFSLNTKQVFVYLIVRYGNKDQFNNDHKDQFNNDHKDQFNEMVWWRIVKKNDNKRFFKREVNSFNFYSGHDVKFELRGCIFPYVGMIRDVKYGDVEIVRKNIER